jgi:hypothetical protein
LGDPDRSFADRLLASRAVDAARAQHKRYVSGLAAAYRVGRGQPRA